MDDGPLVMAIIIIVMIFPIRNCQSYSLSTQITINLKKNHLVILQKIFLRNY